MARVKKATERKIAQGRTKVLMNFETNLERAQRINDAVWVLDISRREFIEKAIDNYYELHASKIEAVTGNAQVN